MAQELAFQEGRWNFQRTDLVLTRPISVRTPADVVAAISPPLRILATGFIVDESVAFRERGEPPNRSKKGIFRLTRQRGT